MTKKREIVEPLKECIFALTKMLESAAKLEETDNNTESMRLKRDLSNFIAHELKDFKKLVAQTRFEVRNRPKRVYRGNPINNLNHKKNQES